MIEFKDFSMLCWNIQGFANKSKSHHTRELIRRHHHDLIFVLETNSPISKAKQFWEQMGYNVVGLEETQSQSRGIRGTTVGV